MMKYLIFINSPDSTRAIHPAALGEDMLVPFIICVPLNVQLGTEVIAPENMHLR